MAGAPERPPDPFATLAQPVGAAQPVPVRLPRVGVVLAAGRSERLVGRTRGGSKALLQLGGLRLVERAVRSLLTHGLERVMVVVGHDAGPVAAVVGRLGRARRGPGRGRSHLGAVAQPAGRLPAPPAGRLTAPAPPQLRVSDHHHSVQYPRDDRGAEVVGQAFSSAPPRSNTDQSGHAFLWSAKVVVAGTR